MSICQGRRARKVNLREEQCQREHQFLSVYASFGDGSRGRKRPEIACDMRTPFQRDRDRILHCKAFRRLKHKTQVFIAPEGDHYRTRLTHTLEVAQIARTIARALRLNEDLTEAIALGHDLGHTPFGHAGERALDQVSEIGFRHYEQSLRIVDVLENGGLGLNLTWETRDGILNHPTKGKPSTMEGKIVRLADKFAYINHDIDDAIRGKIISETDLPKQLTTILGTTTKQRLNRLIHDLVSQSLDKDDILMTEQMAETMQAMRQYMFDHVYIGSRAKIEEVKAKRLVKALYDFFYENPQRLPVEYQQKMTESQREGQSEGQVKARVILDYVAGMTDQYAIRKYQELFIPMSWKEL